MPPTKLDSALQPRRNRAPALHQRSGHEHFRCAYPGLDMQVVMVDGKAVKPVDIHEFRISVAETYDVLVTPEKRSAVHHLR